MGVIRYLRLMRFPLVLTAVADSLAGYLVALGGSDAVDFRIVALLALVSGALYCFGMAGNDIADHERDKLLHPGRVLPSGALHPREAHACVILLGILSAAGVLALSLVSFPQVPEVIRLGRVALWISIALLIVLYNFGGKNFSVGGPVLMGLIRACNFLLGMVYAPSMIEIDRGLGLFAAVSFVYIMCLTLVSTLEDGVPKRGLFLIGAGGMVAAAVGAGIIGWLVVWTFYAPGVAITLVLVGWLLFRIWNVWKLFVRAQVMKLVRDGVMAVILLDASVVLWSGRVLEGGIIAALLLPSLLMLHLFQRAARK